MSSLRNAVKRITHKERAQPRARAHLGILEKKKDYRVRADDYHRKEDRIKAMKEKASMRNPDEFYFGMKNTQVSDGKHRRTEEAAQKAFEERVGTETIRIMKDQDLSYIRIQKQKDAKKAERLKSSLHYLEKESSLSKKRKHTIFVESNVEAETFDAATHFDTVPEMLGRAFNRPRIESLKRGPLAVPESKESNDDEHGTQVAVTEQLTESRRVARKLAKSRSAAYGELEARLKRVEAMEKAEAHLVMEKLVAGKGRKRKIKEAADGMPAQYRWRRKRSS